jgi:8-oxo-dGTP pyrophosphatase MutT (NUDIX family)
MLEASATIPETTGACNRTGKIFLIIVAPAIMHRNQHILLTKRPANVHPPSFWEIPVGKVESGE